MPAGDWATRITLRPAVAQDFDYCASLYFSEMEWAIRELKLDLAGQVTDFRQRWKVTEVRIILLDSVDVGWLQTNSQGDTLFLAQLFVNAAFQRQGIGTEVLKRLIGEAASGRRPIALGVIKTNPALRLYKRLGFRITGDDHRKFFMRHEAGATEPS
jgi:ribosomal protein S18 acetylase RimI-like enzyme